MRPLPPRSILTLSLAGLALAACSTTPVVTPISGASSGAPAALVGYDWFYNADPGADELSLSYGVAESDDVPMDLSCRPGSGALTLLRPVAHGMPARIIVESGGDTETYTARAEASPLHDGQFLTASAKAADPVFKRFRRVGWLAVLDGETRTMMAPHPGSAERVEQFFAACG